MPMTLPGWVEEAARLPVAFAQVREDPLVDAWVVQQLPPGARILMIASGGCTLAYLQSCTHVDSITVVDPNRAQIALARLKLELLKSAEPAERLALLGHARMAPRERLSGLQRRSSELETIGPREVLAEEGPDHAGRYERVFAQLRRELGPRHAEIEMLLQLADPAEQARRIDTGTALGAALDHAFEHAMDLPILVRLFGEGATRNPVETFARHFIRRTRHALRTLPAATNPYLWQVLLGRYPASTPAPWLSLPRMAKLLPVSWASGVMMADFLRTTTESFDFIHLSNILDWLSPAEAAETLQLVHQRLRPAGWTLIRQLNSTLDIPAAGPGFTWHAEQAATLHASDRSYFYRALHLGRRQ